MKVFIIDSKITMSGFNKINCFIENLQKQLQLYAVNFMIVNKLNISRCKSETDEQTIVIFFNDNVDAICHNSEIYNYLYYANEKGALIWPVAMDKERRLPPEIISNKQSYDVWEQLRRRNLGEDYLPLIANNFARKVIARVMPTMYNERGLIFISHRRIDGEEIAANLCDKLLVQFKDNKTFRDLTDVEVGEEAQSKIDEAMSKSDAFIFIHTDKSSESDWIQKELRFALLRNIPILWIQIDNADSRKLKIKPTENPHLRFKSENFNDENLIKISEMILQNTFELIMSRTNKLFDYYVHISEMFKNSVTEIDKTQMTYKLDIKRKGYRYPQRNINQYIKLFGRTPIELDKVEFQSFLKKYKNKYDSALILTDRVVKSEYSQDVIVEPYDDFFYHWGNYLNQDKDPKNMEIVISGAFSDCDEIYKQTLTDALVIFSKSILKSGYILTFGSHPTFQELFFEIAKDTCPNNYNKAIKMYISKWFEDNYLYSKNYYVSNSQFIETKRCESLSKSLTVMRMEMIQRKKVLALICLGGKIKSDKSEEGMREEIALAKAYGIPVFIVGSVGGCSSIVASEYKAINWKGLNNASLKMNNEFAESLDYFSLSQKVLDHLSHQF